MGLIGLLVPIGLLFVVVGWWAEEPGMPVALGVLVTVMGVAGVAGVTAPRHGPHTVAPPVVVVDGGLALPLRRSQFVVRRVVAVSLVALGVLLVMVGDGAGLRVVGVLLALGVIVLGVLSGRSEQRLVVSPVGLYVPGG